MRLLHGSLIHSFNKHILSTLYTSGILAYPGGTKTVTNLKEIIGTNSSKVLFPGIPVLEYNNLHTNIALLLIK